MFKWKSQIFFGEDDDIHREKSTKNEVVDTEYKGASIMSKIIAINAGSSSLKFQLFEMPSETVLTKGLVERIGIADSVFTISVNGEKNTEVTDIPDHAVAVKMLLNKLTEFGIIKDLNEIDGIGHRVVHGGEKFSDSVLLTDETIKEIEDISELAPLHNPANIVGIKAFKEVLPNVPAVAVFDTAFHQTMPEQSYLYSLPYEYYEKFGIRKYGFHGTSHKYVTERAAELLGRPLKDLRLISCHLGTAQVLLLLKAENQLIHLWLYAACRCCNGYTLWKHRPCPDPIHHGENRPDS